jgi:spermidine/putrescine ABC transporter ATP-binding subunit
MSLVELKGVAKSYGSTVALHEVDLEVRQGEFLTLLGPSGCGKTTTLRLIAGFIEPTRGTILLGNEDVTRLPPHRREIGMVFQDYALFPHMTVHDNIGFGLRERGIGRAAIDRRVVELLDLIRLPHIARRYPSELSGGQAQRVAFARAIAHPPRVLLMDEPLGALDLKLREAMQIELRRLQQALSITTIFVTHDQGEAMNMSDRIAVMNLGRIEQIATAEDIYGEPASRFVASFVGQINLIEGTVIGSAAGYATLSTKNERAIRVRATGAIADGSRHAAAIRPEKLRL